MLIRELVVNVMEDGNQTDLDVPGSDSGSIEGFNKSVPDASVPEPPLYLVVLLSAIFFFIFIFGLLGNILVTVVVLRGKTLRTSVNYYVISLCLADLLVIVVCMPTAWVDVYAQDVWYFGDVMCKLVPYLENVVAGASVYTILFICVERHKAICSPLHRVNKTACRVFKIIAIIWSLSVLASLPFAFFPVFRGSVWLDGTPIKVCRHPIRYPWQKPYLVSISLLVFVVPFLIIVTLYCMVGWVLIPRESTHCYRYDKSYNYNLKPRKQGVSTVVLIVSIFFISHLPYRVISLWFIFESHDVLSGLGLEAYLGILYFARVTFYLNHALNPILYNFVSQKFRKEILSMCCFEKYYGGRNLERTKSRPISKHPLEPSASVRCESHVSDGELTPNHKLLPKGYTPKNYSDDQTDNLNVHKPMEASVGLHEGGKFKLCKVQLKDAVLKQQIHIFTGASTNLGSLV